jgi:ribonuclease-3
VTAESFDDSQSQLRDIEERLNYFFCDQSLLEQALTHPSITTEKGTQVIDNQRLEFLGDAVLQLILTERLYRDFGNESEGVLTKWRARVVSRPALATFANELGLGSAMRMGKGEEMNGGRTRASSLSDCMESVLGAVYLDGGFSEATRVTLALAGDALAEVVKSPDAGNPKGQLQEVLQAIVPESPHYCIITEKGPDHEKRFLAEVTWGGQLLGRGEGASKKTAEIAAAANALHESRWQDENAKRST